MQVPEKLSLIGGSILLSSTLIFTLKSQASDILPKVDNGISSLTKNDHERQQDQQKQQQVQEAQAFNRDFQQAQQRGWQTGTWGTAKFYVDGQGNMRVGNGILNKPYSQILSTDGVKTINFDGQAQAPQDSSYLFSNGNYFNNGLTNINNLSNLNTSNVTNMEGMFSGIPHIPKIDLNHFDTSHVTTMDNMFAEDNALSNLDLSHFDTHNVTDMDDMFEDDKSLSILDLSYFDTLKVTDMSYMFVDDNFSQINLGVNTKLNLTTNLVNTYKNGNKALSYYTLSPNGNTQPGTWTKQ